MSMKILVYGAGAVGGYLAGHLAHVGHDLTVIVRPVAAEAINRNGLSITKAGQTIRTSITAVTSVAQAFMSEDTRYDLIILGVKSYDLAAALDPLIAFCPSPPPIITTQNGIDVERPYVEQFGPEQVVAGSITLPISKIATNHLQVERTDRGMALAPIKPGQNIKKWVDLFQSTGIITINARNYKSMKWSKAFLNIIGNASSAILNRPPHIIYKSDSMFELEVRMLQETLNVMDKLKIKIIDLPGVTTTRLATGVRRMPKFLLQSILASQVAKGRGDKMPSFHIDLSADKGKSEVVYHNGAIARIGKAKGVATPVNTALAEVLLKLTQKTVDWREFDGQPKQLLRIVNHYEKQLKRRKAAR